MLLLFGGGQAALGITPAAEAKVDSQVSMRGPHAGSPSLDAESSDVLPPLSLSRARSASDGAESGRPWWIWPLSLFWVSFLVGLLAVVSGTGGGVLYVPFVSGLFPFHLDFVRGAGLMVALCAALAAGPKLLNKNMASLRLAIPMGLVSSLAAIFGAMLGLAMSPQVIQMSLGICILLICGMMILVKNSEYPRIRNCGALASALSLSGIYTEESTRHDVTWKVRHTPGGLCLFACIGLMAGLFGIGGGWAMVPTFNLLMGAPLKLSVATGKMVLGITDTSAAWVYLNRGAIAPMIVVPSVLGAMLGSAVGVRLLSLTKPSVVRWVVIVALAVSGARCLWKGLNP